MWRLSKNLAMVGLVIGLAACSSRPTSEVMTPVAPAPGYTSKVRLLVATTRDKGTGAEAETFGKERAKSVHHAVVTISIPKAHKPGQIEWPAKGAPPDPALNFLTTEREFLAPNQFVGEIRQRVLAGGPEAGSVLVFVHGFNTRYEEAVYRFAQIVHDSGFAGTAVLFAWPSRGAAPLYLADRDASTYSRDYLERTLQQIAAVPGVREVNILAHSMGNWLAVETLRQAKLKGHGDFGGKLGDVILASPDIDINVFRTQLDVIAPLRRPITLMVSGDDQALSVSTFLSGGVQRAGQMTAGDARVVAAAQRYNLVVVDLTNVDDGTSSHHSKFAVSPAVVRAIGKGIADHDAGAKAEGGLVQAVTNIGGSLLQVPAAIVGAP